MTDPMILFVRVFNGPMARARYQILPQYIASPGFLGLGIWRNSRVGNIYAVTAPLGEFKFHSLFTGAKYITDIPSR